MGDASEPPPDVPTATDMQQMNFGMTLRIPKSLMYVFLCSATSQLYVVSEATSHDVDSITFVLCDDVFHDVHSLLLHHKQLNFAWLHCFLL